MTDLPRISVSAKAAIVRGSDILLMSYDDHAGFHYNLPGGKARQGESLREALRRKVEHETGLVVEVGRLLYVVEYVPEMFDGEFGDVQKVQFNFLATATDVSAEPRMANPPVPDQVGFEWVPVAELSQKRLLPRVTVQLTDALVGGLADPLVDRW